jgi:putative transposase
VENTLADALGAEAALSKSTVPRVCQAIGEQSGAWRTRPLDGVLLDYLFLDASMFRMHPGARAEPVLAAWGIDTEGKPVFVALAAGGSESADAWVISWMSWPAGGCGRRCWSSPTAPPG